MKISYNWLKDYLDFDLSTEQMSELLTALGLEVEGMETYESVKGGLKGIVAGHVVECGQHPNADRLSVTKVDIGSGELLHIVCGAPNVAAGQKVVVAPVGSTLYSADGEAFHMKKAKIRGAVSMGMICAEDELGIGVSHDGILVLDEDTKAGTPATDLFDIYTDTVYEIGLTPNRSDATSHIGVARDLAAALKYRNMGGTDLKVPEAAIEQLLQAEEVQFKVEVPHTEACPRYAGLIIKNLKIGESPDWLKNRLASIGVRPINNVVDITNFVLHEYGQPLHAFDLDQISGQGIIVDTLPQDTSFVTLDEKERKLRSEDLMICNSNREPMCIGGVFGGLNSGVTDDTKNIFLESAHFNAKFIRRSSMKHDLRTDAAKVFEKGSDPAVVIAALKRAAKLMNELAEGQIHGPLYDIYPTPIRKKEVKIDFSHVSRLLGVELSKDEIKRLAACLDMDIVKEDSESLVLSIPTSKSDVTREADVIEEFLRIYGYDNIPISNKLNTSIVQSELLDSAILKDNIAAKLNGLGFHQMMNLSLSQSKHYESASEAYKSQLLYILNTSNSHLDIMRPDMLHSALETIGNNLKHRASDFRMFEFGRVYRKKEASYWERERISLCAVGKVFPENWIKLDTNADFFLLKSAIERIIPSDVYERLQIQSETNTPWYDYRIKLIVNGKTIGQIGAVNKAKCGQFEIDKAVYYGEIEWKWLLNSWKKWNPQFKAFSKYPSVRRDLALVIDQQTRFEELEKVIKKSGGNRLKSVDMFDVYENEEQLGSGKKSYAISMIFEDETKTLKDKEVDKMIKKITSQLEFKTGAKIR
jgi:phenylalanyl-tRNA synthetase beta chain